MHRSTRPIGLIATTIFCLILALVVPGLAFAQDDEEEEYEDEIDYGRPGVYAMVHIMGGVDVDRRIEDDTQLTGGAGYILRVGSRETPRLAWEVAFEQFVLDGTSSQSFTYGLNGKYYFTQNRWQPYLVLGANGRTMLREGAHRQTDWSFRMGGGLDFYLTEKWALNLESTYVAGVGDLLYQEYGSFALGVLYRF